MKQLLAGLALVLLVACSGSPKSLTSASPDEGAPVNATPPAGAVELNPSSCPAAAAHVYHPQRLHLLDGCREQTLTGVIKRSKAEADGDFHIQLLLDASQRDPQGGAYINSENTRQQAGALVLEPVCENQITQKDAVAACNGYHNPIQVLPDGTHVRAVGYWVFDAQHGWNELHPLSSLVRADPSHGAQA